MGKSQIGVLDAMQNIKQALPFKLLGIDSDNGSEFINYHLKTFCDQTKPIHRGRLTKKTTTPYRTEKLDHVRKIFGYERYDSRQTVQAMNDLYQNELRILQNLFRPENGRASGPVIGSDRKEGTVSDGRRDLEEIAPGNILQHMHLKRRIRKLQAERASARSDSVTTVRAKEACSASCWRSDLPASGRTCKADSCARNASLNRAFVSDGRYRVIHGSSLTHDFGDEPFDVAFSCMVIAHLPPQLVDAYFTKFRGLLAEDGLFITVVPGSMKHWGIEDETVGHFKRYSFDCFREIGRIGNLNNLFF